MSGQTQFYVHPTADVSPESRVSEGTVILHEAQVREGAQIGRQFVIGKGVDIDSGVCIGDRIKIQSNVSVFHGVTIENGVLMGPDACFTNDKHPCAVKLDGSAKDVGDWFLGETLIRESAALGANSMPVCGIVVGRWVMVGAGSVLKSNVPDHGLVWGNPTRLHGFVCPCGERLQEPKDLRCESIEALLMKCKECGLETRIALKDYSRIGRA
jgi:acetyltransferase-like isoleucine patch superfamily enzyme